MIELCFHFLKAFQQHTGSKPWNCGGGAKDASEDCLDTWWSSETPRRAATIHHQSNIMIEYSRAVLTFARMLDAV